MHVFTYIMREKLPHTITLGGGQSKSSDVPWTYEETDQGRGRQSRHTNTEFWILVIPYSNTSRQFSFSCLSAISKTRFPKPLWKAYMY